MARLNVLLLREWDVLRVFDSTLLSVSFLNFLRDSLKLFGPEAWMNGLRQNADDWLLCL